VSARKFSVAGETFLSKGNRRITREASFFLPLVGSGKRSQSFEKNQSSGGSSQSKREKVINFRNCGRDAFGCPWDGGWGI